MFNFTCMELRRLSRQKSTYIILLTAAVTLFLLTLVLNLSFTALESLDNSGNYSEEKDGIIFEVSLEPENQSQDF